MRGRFALSDSDSSISQNTPPAVHINLPGRRLEIPNPKTPSRANPALKSPRTPRNNHQPVVRQATPRPANTRAQLLGNIEKIIRWIHLRNYRLINIGINFNQFNYFQF